MLSEGLKAKLKSLNAKRGPYGNTEAQGIRILYIFNQRLLGLPTL